MKRISVMLIIVTALLSGCSSASTDTSESPSVFTTAEQESKTMVNEDSKILFSVRRVKLTSTKAKGF